MRCLAALLAALSLGAVAAPSDLDTTFGSAGKATTALPDGSGYIEAVAFLPDGKILVAGTQHPANVPVFRRFAVARFNANGTLILWRNMTTGQPWVWIMDANNITGGGPLPTLSDLSWQIVRH